MEKLYRLATRMTTIAKAHDLFNMLREGEDGDENLDVPRAGTAEESGAAGSAGRGVTSSVRRRQIPRSADAANEFTQNRRLLVHAFPTHFVLGHGPAREGTLSVADCRHLLLQYNPAFGKCAQLIFLLFAQFQRHRGIAGLAGAVRNNAVSFRAFQELVEDTSLDDKFAAAERDPNTPAAKAFIKTLDKTLKMYAANIPFCAASRTGRVGDFIAMMRHFGWALFFNTIAPDPIGDLAALRRTFPTFSNRGFPAEDAGFAAQVRAGGSEADHFSFCAFPDGVEEEVSLSPTALLSRATTHAVPSAEGFRLDTDALSEHVYGVPLADSVRKTTPVALRPNGVFGPGRCITSVNECNGKGWLHNHALCACGMPSWAFQTLQQLGADPAFKQVLARFVNGTLTAEISGDVHVQFLLRRVSGFSPYRGPWRVPPVKDDDNDRYRLHSEFYADRTQVHFKHGSRCRKGKVGTTACSQAYPRTLREETAPTEIGGES
jgi:hypothetical protein